MNCPECDGTDIEMDLSFTGCVYPVSFDGVELVVDFSGGPTVDDFYCESCGWKPTGNFDLRFL